MASDRARVSYDPSRRYHGVVAQQGRVSLEADWNEAQAISREQTEAGRWTWSGRPARRTAGTASSPSWPTRARPPATCGSTGAAAYIGGQRVSLRARHALQQPARLAGPCRGPALAGPGDSRGTA